MELGALNTVVALSIAVVRASLVFLFFMHVFYGTRLTKLIVGAGLFWLILLLRECLRNCAEKDDRYCGDRE